MQNISALGQGANIFTDGIGKGSAIVNVTNGGQFFNNVGGNINMTTLSNRLAIGIIPSMLWSFAKSIVIGFASAHPLIATASVTGLCCAMLLQPVRDAVSKFASEVMLWVTKKHLLFNFKLLTLTGIVMFLVTCLHRAPCDIIGAFSSALGVSGDVCKVLSSEYSIGRALSSVFGELSHGITGILNYCLWSFGIKCVCDLMIIGLIKYGAQILNWSLSPLFGIE